MAFKKGESGNPAGRKPGNCKISKLREGIAKEIPEIINALVAAAKAGDPAAAKILLDKVLPSLKPESRSPAPAPTTPDEIISALSTGTITLDQGAILMGIAAAKVRIMEGQELLDRIETLENLLHKG
jgi:hypothetical protein